jgi:glycosyltransferase involved in cell wall biosynthesis
MRIGLYYEAVSGWQGGRDLFTLLFRSLQLAREPDDQITIIAQQGWDSWPWRVAHVGKHVLTRYPWESEWLVNEIFRTPKKKAFRQTFGQSTPVKWLQRQDTQIDCDEIFSAFDVIGPFQSPPPLHGNRPWVGYITDCQHRRFPHNFSAEECARRDRVYAELLQVAPALIVNSKNAKADLTRYYGLSPTEIVVLPFAAAADPAWVEFDPAATVGKYRLARPYFICSNQFWKHKNQGVILEALAIARAQGKVFRVVFTGATHDFSSSNHFKTVVERAEKLDVARYCRFLGLLSKLDQIGLIRSAIATIQPSLFEGGPGGGSVYDAIALGQQVIVSDIPVNREIEQHVDEYFSPDDPHALFLAMCRAEERPTLQRPREALLAEGQQRRRQCGAALRTAFALAMERSCSAVQPVAPVSVAAS